MEKAKKARTFHRVTFTKQYTHVISLMSDGKQDIIQLKAAFRILQVKYEEIRALDKEVFNLMLEDTSSERELETDYEVLKKKLAVLFGKVTADDICSVSSGMTVQRRFRLPQIELKKFDSNLKDWLHFWGLFKKLDDDPTIDNEEKLQYLIQSTVQGSRARTVVESFPPTAAKYPKAIDALKSRFGREELIELYVRELLGLVTSTTSSLASLYDKLECQLRALESLGVTSDKCSPMLFPLMESCLPEDFIRVRSYSADTTTNSKDKLKKLMSFMGTEVENEEKISMAVAGIVPSKTRDYKKRFNQNEKSFTAAELLTTSSNSSHCIVCYSMKHKSFECREARGMSLSDKKKLIFDKRCCFTCLKPGHTTKKCRVYVRCDKCQKRHYLVMCPFLYANDIQGKYSERPLTSEVIPNVSKENSLTSLTRSTEVHLQTIVVISRNNNGYERRCRALIDTASQRSYVLTKTAIELGLPIEGEETIVHCLFGGINSTESSHKSYKIYLCDLNRRYFCNFLTLDQERICGNIKVANSDS